jgi:hypothetical protein
VHLDIEPSSRRLRRHLLVRRPHDPFFPLLLAAEHTERVQLTTAVASRSRATR